MHVLFSMVSIFFCYALYSYITCDKSLRDSKFFFIYGALCSLLAQIIWMWLSRKLNNVNQILIYNTIKTALIILAGALVPVMVYGAKMNKSMMVGMALIIVGGLLMRN